MSKIVYNACYGGFGLSEEGVEAYARHKGITLYKWSNPKYKSASFNKSWFTAPIPEDNAELSNDFWRAFQRHRFTVRDIERDDPALVAAVEELGDKASGSCANLEIEEVIPGTAYRITEYDGYETVEINNAIDWKIAR